MRTPGAWLLLVWGLASLLAGCGGEVRPSAGEPSGPAAEELGEIFDLDVELPHLVFPDRAERGARLTLVLEISGRGEGRRPARVVLQSARVGGAPVPVVDLGSGEVQVDVAGDDWQTSRIGPLQLEGSAFEVVLRGRLEDAGHALAGVSWESQSGLEGTFVGWRRQRFLVAATDFLSSGRLRVLSVARGRELIDEGAGASVSSDPVLSRAGAVIVINRLGFDNLQRLDPGRDFATAWQRRVGEGSNPHDALVVDGRGFVTRYEPPFSDLARFDPGRGEVDASVGLEELAENDDGYPRPDRLAFAAGKIFVGLQDIDRTFTRYADGKLAVVDPVTLDLEGAILLPGRNPGRILVAREAGREKLFVALAGIFPGLLPQELSGGVAVVDVANRVFERWALDDDAAGGNVADLALASPRLGYVLVSDADYVHRVLAFDPAVGEVRRTVLESPDFVPAIALSGGGVLAVPDRDYRAPGVCFYRVPRTDVTRTETALGCLPVGLPPAALSALD
ncbi:MAG: hypothetical protein Q9Q40_04760 [Acidobacteriota bacterium]|nr:hypothetical protein [Acidobacteriota bacterium]MDQ7088816.1 hypothetical protein [Acidobacteriota bacterium]